MRLIEVKRFLRWMFVLWILLVLAVVIASFVGVRYAYEPSSSNVISRRRPNPEQNDLWGITTAEASDPGVVRINDRLLKLGRDAFYKETFKNEIFLTDVVGILNGPLNLWNLSKALLELQGKGTTNLRVEIPYTVTIGDHVFRAGTYVDTGLDVPKGALIPMGMAITWSGFKIRAGITCAACHATVDAESMKVVEGAPNQDLNAGLLLALATNSTAYFMHTDVSPAEHPDPKELEDSVDAALRQWPRGNFDSLTDMKTDPTQIPSAFTWQAYPYGWSGNFMAGPFHGLTSQNNNVHALNSDSLLLADASPFLFGMDKESYLKILLQNAADPKLRYSTSSGQSAVQFWLRVDPTATSPGINQVVLPPTYPKGTILSPDGTFTSSPGFRFWEQNNAMSAWQNTIVPPEVPLRVTTEEATLGRQVFQNAHCDTCHAGPFLTNHRVVPSFDLGTNGTRASALQKTELNFTDPVVFPFSTAVPIQGHPQPLPVPLASLDPTQIDLAWAHHGSPGGYKVPSLVGIYWTAPYLHDGGLAVGPNRDNDLGLPGTVERNVMPDPANSLLAMVDRNLRSRVVAANAASPSLVRMNVTGAGHNYWVDQTAGYTAQQQQALIRFLLAYQAPQ